MNDKFYLGMGLINTALSKTRISNSAFNILVVKFEDKKKNDINLKKKKKIHTLTHFEWQYPQFGHYL